MFPGLSVQEAYNNCDSVDIADKVSNALKQYRKSHSGGTSDTMVGERYKVVKNLIEDSSNFVSELLLVCYID